MLSETSPYPGWQWPGEHLLWKRKPLVACIGQNSKEVVWVKGGSCFVNDYFKVTPTDMEVEDCHVL